MAVVPPFVFAIMALSSAGKEFHALPTWRGTQRPRLVPEVARTKFYKTETLIRRYAICRGARASPGRRQAESAFLVCSRRDPWVEAGDAALVHFGF